MYKICATKRDLDIIDRKLYRFIPDLWEVNVTSKGIYLLKYEDGLYNLYSNDEKTSLFIPNISLIRGCVYEGLLVTVELTDDSLKRYIGTLIQINQDGEKAVSKSVVLSESECSLKSPSQEYVDNRLVREEDLVRPAQISVYFDPRYLSVDHVKTNGIEVLPMSFIPQYIDRLPGDAMSSEVQKTQACNAITCSKGDRVIVTKKTGVEYDIVITKVTDYASLETVLVNDNDTLEFDVNLTVFIEFQIPLDIYTLYTHCGEIHTGPASVTVNSTIDGTTTMLLHGECNEFGDYSVTSTPILVLPQKVVKIEVEATCSAEIGAPLVYSPTIRNLVTNLELSKTNISSNLQTWTGTFTMPEADCLVSPKLKYIYHDGGQEDINPVFYLTVKSSDVSKVTINNVEYILTDGPITIPCDVAYLNWELVDGYTSKIDVYSTEYPSNVFYSKVGFITHEDWVLSSNTTIEISLKQVDCEYKSFRGKVESLSKGKKWNSSNSILEVSGNVPYKTYYVDTNVLIADSGEPNHFEGTEVEEVVFYNPADSFYIHPKAFKKCEYLKSIDLSKSSNIRVKDLAFWGSFSLSDFKNTLAISELGEYSFTNTDLPSFTYGSKLLQIPNYTFMNCRDLADVDYESSSSLESVGKLAFDNCRKLKHAVFPVSLSKIGDLCFGENAFSAVHTSPAYCDKTITDSASCVFNVDSLDFKNGMTELPEYAFEYCKNIKEVYLPASINLIKKGAFLECDNLKYFASPGLKMIELGAFSNTWIETKHTYNSGEMELRGDGSGKIYRYKDTEGIYFDYCRGELANPNDHVVCIKPNPDKNNYILYKRPCQFSGVTNVYFHVPIFGVADYGFAYNEILDWLNPYDVNFNAYAPLGRLEYIGKYAFKDSGVKFVTFVGKLLHTLGEGAFYNCHALRNVFGLEESLVTKIEPYTFYNCGGDYYGLGWYDGSTSIPALDFCIPQNTTSIGDYAFANCNQLMGIKNISRCPITHIGEYAFFNCFRNTHRIWDAIGATVLFAVKTVVEVLCIYGFSAPIVKISETVSTTVAKTVFTRSYDFITTASKVTGALITTGTALTVADGTALIVTAITPDKSDSYPSSFEYALDRCKEAGNTRIKLWLPKVSSIGKGAFKNCTYLGEVKFCNTMTEIPDYAFYNCKRLSNVTFASPDFSWDNVASSTLEAEPHLVKIGKESFYNCNNLWDISINNMLCGVVSIGERAFQSSKINYSSFRNADGVDINMGIVIDSTTTELHHGSLEFEGKHTFTFIAQNPESLHYSSLAFNSENTELIVPLGSKSAYMSVFKYMKSDQIREVELNSQYWKDLKTLGYTVPWLNN